MNWFDLTVGIALILAIINGFRKGLVMQLAGLAIVILSAVFGGKLAKSILPWITETFEIEFNFAIVISYILAFLGIYLVIVVLGKLIQGVLKVVNLNIINRLLGAVIAMGTMMVVLSILLNLILMIDKNEMIIKKDIKENSFFYERVEAVIPAIVPYLNKDVWDKYIHPDKLKTKKTLEDLTTYKIQSGQIIFVPNKSDKLSYANTQRG